MRTLTYGLFTAQEKATTAREVAERFRALSDVLVQRDPAGLSPLLETRIIEATELTMQRKAGDAELAAQSALLELNQLRGAAPDARISIAQPHLVFRPADAQDTLVALARTNHFELRAAPGCGTGAAGFRVALAKNERFPVLRVGPTITEENAFERERVIGVGISFPLPLWNRNSANIEVAAARQLQAETSFSLTQREIERKVLEASFTL